MGLESVTYISDLNSAFPADSDLEVQGAAHLRNIKTALLNTFPGGSRRVGVQRMVPKTSTFSVLQTDAGSTFLVDTTATGVSGLVMTLPVLSASDNGWEIEIIKVNSGLGPIFVKPTTGVLASGGLAGLSSTRRCIPGVPTRVIWTGSGFFCTRAGAAPVGTVLEFDGTVLPIGFEWPNGQTFDVNLYPDYAAAVGTTTYDKRGRISAFVNQGATGRIGIVATDTGTLNGGTIGSAAGSQTHQLTAAEQAHMSVGGTCAADSGGNVFVTAGPTGNAVLGDRNIQNQSFIASLNVQSTAQVAVTGTIAGTASGGGVFGNAHAIMPPTIMKNFILVVE